jgi:hypothetical protein
MWTGSRNVDGMYREASYGTISIPQEMGGLTTGTEICTAISFSFLKMFKRLSFVVIGIFSLLR